MDLRQILIALTLLLCAGCAAATTPQPAASPSPTIAAALPAARPTPTIANAASQPTRRPLSIGQGSAPALEPSIYLWPAYLPPDMRISPSESRVAGESETGAEGFGFYLVTLNAGTQKLSIGGGDIEAVLPLTGDERPVTVGTRSAKLIASGDKREIVFDVPRGKLFVYSSGLSEEELLKVAASLQPIDVQALRAMIAAK